MTPEETSQFYQLLDLVRLSRKRLVEVEHDGKTLDIVIEESLLSDEELDKVKSKLLKFINID